ncbi:MAG: helix-turn-helix transcriptional regulator [Clostridia bacterium]|nr:helix-turn-helix transcriptional regulator [Clostridia bacterium]
MKNLSQQQLAEKLNVSFKTISHWELGYSEPSLAILTKLKEILSASYEELLD